MGKQIVIANWKMNLNIHEASLLTYQIDHATVNHRSVEIVLAPSYLALQSLSLQIDHSKFKLPKAAVILDERFRQQFAMASSQYFVLVKPPSKGMLARQMM